MAGEEAFRVEGRVMEALPNGTFRVELKNGHRLTAFVAGRTKKNFAGLRAGDAILKVDGNDVSGLPLDQVVSRFSRLLRLHV